mmetsp:Transcript_1029/g.2432  ORF Transcript_1029/g.2432 Transcript_1029/m.2432 type:complete len:273 (-) Transcript_1029:365-1183(-)|eukprot:CAMPEP_0119559844 /NCGR_PEP_ID=MMETSP1352-20130426/13456_1 /TAXON_ID=265584 /ORGANISM="Stauroneis constricta, Strain CCMP1120" /LENGTH=272 /DNA_ID=CAMNT_0007607645 /DNA_START=50 /DNA_END=868 /DNA_ORIENTATION=-
MGNCLGATPAGVDTTASKDVKAKADAKPEQPQADAAPAAAAKEAPTPRIFALMRNGHEVLRGSMEDITALLEKGDADAAAETYLRFERWMNLHKLMEEGNGSSESPRGFFAVLDEKFEGVVDKNGLRDDHETLDRLEHTMSEACKQDEKDLERLRELWSEFKDENEKHLKKEEGVMMPRVMEMVKSGVSLKVVMKTEILPLVEEGDDFEFFVKFANETLNNHLGGMPRVRVFDHALWAVVEPSKWEIYDKWIKDTVTSDQYEELQKAIKGIA